MTDSNPESNSVRRLLTSDVILQFNKLIILLGNVEQYKPIVFLLSCNKIEKKDNNLT